MTSSKQEKHPAWKQALEVTVKITPSSKIFQHMTQPRLDAAVDKMIDHLQAEGVTIESMEWSAAYNHQRFTLGPHRYEYGGDGEE